MSSRNCLPCLMQKKISVAVKFCKDCQESLCNTCMRSHSTFSAFIGHTTVDNPKDIAKEVPEETCKLHDGKLVVFYCTWHNKVACSTCKNKDHGHFYCNVQKISDYLESNPVNLQKTYEKTDITKVLHEMMLLKKLHIRNREVLKKAKEEATAGIKIYEEDIKNVLQRQRTDKLTDVENKFDDLDGKYEKAISYYGDLIAELKKHKDEVHSPEISTVQKFVKANILETNVVGAKDLFKKEFAKQETLKFSKNKKMLATLSKSRTGLGRIEITSVTMPLKSKM